MIYRKKTAGFNLAFLDIMSCGLGAIILVFMLIKHNINDSPVEQEQLKNDIETLEQSKQDARSRLEQLEAETAESTAYIAVAKTQYDNDQAVLNKQYTDEAITQQQIVTLKDDIKGIKIPKKEDLVAIEQVNEETYLLGLKVEGKKIAILIDSSASMSNEKLIDIIKTKSSSNAVKQRASKWLRTKRVAKWLLARLPKNSDVVVISFNETAQVLGSKIGIKSNRQQAVAKVLAELNHIVPTGATNLQQGLDLANQHSPSNIYIITDGLPTKGESNYKSLNPFASCSSLSGKSHTISGVCRVKLFQQTILESGTTGAQIDVVLLPLEGDPDAINQYWTWTSSTGGLVISPAKDWP